MGLLRTYIQVFEFELEREDAQGFRRGKGEAEAREWLRHRAWMTGIDGGHEVFLLALPSSEQLESHSSEWNPPALWADELERFIEMGVAGIFVTGGLVQEQGK